MIKKQKLLEVATLCICGFLTLFLLNDSVMAKQPLLHSATVIGANDQNWMNIFSQNDILYYEPICNSTYSAWNGDEVTWEQLDQIREGDTRASVTLLAETYGELAMALQEEYGVPWELVFIQMGNESGGGVNGRDGTSVAINIRNKDGKYNLLGMDTPGNRANNMWASEATYPYTDGANGSKHEAAEYDSISLMIIGYVAAYFRNGIYDTALEYWGYQNFDFWTGFAAAMCHYIGTPGSCSSSYSDPNGNGGWFYDVVADVAKAKGWPSSEELAKQKRIMPGGNWPIEGDIRQKIWAAYGAAGLPSSNSAVAIRNSNGIPNGTAVADKAKEFSWEIGSQNAGKYIGNEAYNEAAEKLGNGFVNPIKDDECNKSSENGFCYSCARFVSLSIYESGADQEFVAETKAMGNNPHMIGDSPRHLTYYLANSDNWEQVEDYDGAGYDNLQAGDVLIWDKNFTWKNLSNKKTAPYDYHTFIYVGEGIVAEASNSDFAPYQHEWDSASNDGYVAFRLKNTGNDGRYCGGMSVSGDFDKNILKYAWPNWNATRKDATPDYQELVNSGKYYNGGGATDCNGFVTKMIVVSEIDPNYNSEYGTCATTLSNIQGSGWGANWEMIYSPGQTFDTSKLKKGDVFLNRSHTFLFVGNIPGFQCDIASASLDDHVPVACQGENINASGYSGGAFYVFRKR